MTPTSASQRMESSSAFLKSPLLLLEKVTCLAVVLWIFLIWIFSLAILNLLFSSTTSHLISKQMQPKHQNPFRKRKVIGRCKKERSCGFLGKLREGTAVGAFQIKPKESETPSIQKWMGSGDKSEHKLLKSTVSLTGKMGIGGWVLWCVRFLLTCDSADADENVRKERIRRKEKKRDPFMASLFFLYLFSSPKYHLLPLTSLHHGPVFSKVLLGCCNKKFTGVSPNEKQLKGLSKVWPTWMYGNQVREGMNWLNHLIILYWSKVWSVSNQTMAWTM